MSQWLASSFFMFYYVPHVLTIILVHTSHIEVSDTKVHQMHPPFSPPHLDQVQVVVAHRNKKQTKKDSSLVSDLIPMRRLMY